MKHAKPFLLVSLAVVACWLAFMGEAHAGLFDQGANWLLGLVAGAVGGGAVGAGVVHVANRSTAQGGGGMSRTGLDLSGTSVAPQPTKRAKNASLKTADAADQNVAVYKVWYATNRKIVAGEFTSELSEQLRYGDCQVAIPQSHKFGSLGSSSTVRWLQRVRTGSDDALRIVKRSGWSAEEGPHGFLTSVAATLQDKSNQIVVYVHGYNVTFENAILRAAQIGFDLKVPGVTAAFCWPSKGSEAAYMADEDTVRLTASQLAEFLAMLKANFPDHKINILAHSMGNRALIEVLEQLERYPALTGAKFNQIILAAPDIDTRYFRKVAAAYPRLSERTTLYICAADQALHLSKSGHANDRIGYCPPVTVASGIDTVEATNVNLDMLGHGYYASAALVLNDIYTLLRCNIPPADRPGLAKMTTDDGLVYWQFRAANA